MHIILRKALHGVIREQVIPLVLFVNVCIGWVPAVEHGGSQDNGEQWVARAPIPGILQQVHTPLRGGMFEKPP